jgi:hypothetical protein
MKLTVWIYRRTDADGYVSTGVFPDENAAWDPLIDYVLDQWSDGAMEGLVPDDCREAVEAYFEEHENETFDFRARSVDFGEYDLPPKQEEGIVDLTHMECEVIRNAMCSYPARQEVAELLEMTSQKAGGVMNKIYEKLKP